MNTKKTITITGATGNIGSKLVPILINAGAHVRVIGRDAEKLKSFVANGAKAYVGDINDSAFLAQAFRGSDVVFSLIPPLYNAESFRGYQNVVSDAIARAIVDAGVTSVVNLSSLGADLSEGSGPIIGLHDHEQRLNKINGLNIIHLRPAYFFENIYFSLGLIAEHGILGSPISPDVKFAQVGTNDIATRAAELLLQGRFDGIKIEELAGPEDITMAQVTKSLGEIFSKPNLPYVQFAPADARTAMIGSGLSLDVAEMFLQLYASINKGRIKPVGGRNVRNTSATSFAEFANVLIPTT